MHICECSWPIKKRQHKHSDKFSNNKAAKKELVGKKLFIKAGSRHAAEHSTHAHTARGCPPPPLAYTLCVPGILARSEVSTAVATVVAAATAAFGLVLYETRPPPLGRRLVWLKAKPSAGTKPQQRRAKRKMNCRKKKEK